MSESWDDQLARLELMASGDSKWDLSDNDTAAISEALRRIVQLDRAGKAADPTSADREARMIDQQRRKGAVDMTNETELRAACEAVIAANEQARQFNHSWIHYAKKGGIQEAVNIAIAVLQLLEEKAKRYDWLKKMAAAEDEAGCISVGGLAHDIQEREKASEDAERYRFLRDKGYRFSDVSLGAGIDGDYVRFRSTFDVPEIPGNASFEESEWTPEQLDAAIDAARKATK